MKQHARTCIYTLMNVPLSNVQCRYVLVNVCGCVVGPKAITAVLGLGEGNSPCP